MKPCPFCGHPHATLIQSREAIEHDDDEIEVITTATVMQMKCVMCGARGPELPAVNGMQAAAAAEWNKREVQP